MHVCVCHRPPSPSPTSVHIFFLTSSFTACTCARVGSAATRAIREQVDRNIHKLGDMVKKGEQELRSSGKRVSTYLDERRSQLTRYLDDKTPEPLSRATRFLRRRTQDISPRFQGALNKRQEQLRRVRERLQQRIEHAPMIRLIDKVYVEYIYTHTHTHTYSLTHSLIHTHTYTCTHTCTHTHTHALARSLIRTYALTHSHVLTQIRCCFARVNVSGSLCSLSTPHHGIRRAFVLGIMTMCLTEFVILKAPKQMVGLQCATFARARSLSLSMTKPARPLSVCLRYVSVSKCMCVCVCVCVCVCDVERE
jgi:hypothetical protein